MAHITDYLKPGELTSIKYLQVLAKQVVEGFITGIHRSPQKGVSIEFAQHREYVQGDEIRRVDWKVYAKSDRYYVREYEEETNLRATLLLDSSGSMGYGGEGRINKHTYAVRLAAALAYLLLQQRDSVGMISFDTKLRQYIPPRSNDGHLRRMLEAMVASAPGNETSLGQVFHSLAPRMGRRGLVMILSDGFGETPELLKALAHFRSAMHEVIFFHILDPDEVEFPFRDWTRFQSLENGSQFRKVDPLSYRAAYLENFHRFEEELRLGCRKNRVELVPMRTDEPFDKALAGYMNRRNRVAA
ncbi:MAG: DUF58 domain-containing protein [Verrucomicrobiales bacterium]|nr:DUF58 domain-containing protein [Verrucomicrobiales bacterium]